MSSVMAEKKVTGTYYAFPYLADFSCTGSECPESCCKGWDIRLDREGFARLKQVMDVSPEERQRFMKSVSLNSDSSRPGEFASFRRDSQGVCAFLDPDELCHLQKKFGQETLTPTCAFYPRVLSRLDKDIEISGALSCPEMARLCLLDDTFPDLIRVDESILPRPDSLPAMRTLDPSPGASYRNSYFSVRPVLEKILSREEYPLSLRLFLLCNFANRIGEQVNHNVETYDPKWLVTEIQQFLEPANLQKTILEYHSTEVEEPLTMMLVFSFLKGRVDQGGDHKLVRLGNDILATCERETGTALQNEAFSGVLWDHYRAFRQQYFSPELQSRIDQMLTRYCLNQIYREWYIGYPDLLSYLHMLIVRTAILAFLIVRHPAILGRLHEGGQIDVPLLEAVAIEATYSFSRSIDHNVEYLKAMYEAMEHEGLFTYDYSPVLSHF